MGKTVRVATEISEELNSSLERLAGESGQDKERLIERALRAFVQSEEQFAAAVQEGIEAWKAGDMVDHAALAAEFERRYGAAP
ncbi:MAG TPA: hypothetical protein VD860_13960 [Azospirillum sp.]|nr:hypothetical protein [Azospirillum sp.]